MNVINQVLCALESTHGHTGEVVTFNGVFDTSVRFTITCNGTEYPEIKEYNTALFLAIEVDMIASIIAAEIEDLYRSKGY